jgi:K+-sensing histidine kinase KdpD
MAHSTSPKGQLDQQIPLADVVQFLRQFIHDIRNHLNAAELQSAYLGEIIESKEAKEEIKRLRAMVSEASGSLQLITSSLSEPRLTRMPYTTGDFLTDLRQRVETTFPGKGPQVTWDIKVKDAKLEIDPQALLAVLTELFDNAFRHDPAGDVISVEAKIADGRLLLLIHEPKKGFSRSTESWGRKPFVSIKKGHYSLGLHRTFTIIQAHGGQLSAHYDSAASTLVTTVELPLAE